MHLRRLEVANFRNLRSVCAKPTPLMVVIGENGCGKSNLLHALRLLLDPAAQHLQAALSEADINSEAMKAGERFFAVEVEIGGLSNHPDLQAVFAEWIDIDDAKDEFVTIRGAFEDGDSGELTWSATVQSPAESKAKPGTFTRRMWRLLPLLYVDPVRDASREARIARGSLLEQLVRDVDLSGVEADVLAAMKTADAKLGAVPALKSLNDSLEATAKDLLPGREASLSLSLAGHDAQSLLRTLQLVLSVRSGEPGLPAALHATGYQNVLLIAMYKALRELHSDVHPILAVEEPEAHLHPHAQRRLLRELSEIGGPTIITTHSPAVAEVTSPQCLLRLRSIAAASTSAHQFSAEGLSATDARNFELMIRAGRSEVFFARAAVVVEGYSEAFALPVFATALGIDLDRDGVSILNAEGNAFEYALRVLDEDALNVRTVVTFDTDALSHDPKLVRTAKNLGLVTEEELEKVKKDRDGVADERANLLAGAGWIPVEQNFEYVACSAGYLAVVLDEVERQGMKKKLAAWLAGRSAAADPREVALFIGKHSRLKTPVAEAIAAAVPAIGKVPPCYEQALRNAVA